MYFFYFIGVEITGPSKRGLGGAILSCYYSVGEIILGLIVWLEDDWRKYLRIIYIPGFILVTYFWYLESFTLYMFIINY